MKIKTHYLLEEYLDRRKQQKAREESPQEESPHKESPHKESPSRRTVVPSIPRKPVSDARDDSPKAPERKRAASR